MERLHRSDARLTVHLLGPLRVYHGTRPVFLPRKQARWLLAYLLYFPAPQRREKVSAALWPDIPYNRARRLLSRTLWHLRSALGPTFVHTEGESIQLTGEIWCDIHAFREGIYSEDPAQIEQALALYTGDFLEECAQDWAVIARERLRQDYLSGLRRLIAAYRDRGMYTRALIWAHRLVEAAPLQEWGHREIMRLYALLGDIEGAREQYRKLTHLLEQELRTTPSPTTRALLQDIETLTRLPSAPTPPTPPLIGRSREWQEIFLTLTTPLHPGPPTTPPCALLVGPPGSGKTALLNALRRSAELRGVWVWDRTRNAPPGPEHPLRQILNTHLTPLLLEHLLPRVPPQTWQRLAPILRPIRERLRREPPILQTEAPLTEEDPAGALHHLLQVLGSEHPLALIIEDVTSIDPNEASLIMQLCNEPKRRPVAVILSARAEHTYPLHVKFPPLAQSEQAGQLRVISLPPLSREDVALLIQQRLNAHVDPKVNDIVYRVSGGWPGIALLWIHMAQKRGILQLRENTWQVNEIAYKTWKNNLGTIAEESTWGQRYLAYLPSPLRQPIALAAVLGDPITPRVWARLNALSEEHALAQLHDLTRMGLLQEKEHGFVWTGEGVRRAIYTALPQEERTRLHRLVAETLLAEGEPNNRLVLHIIRGHMLPRELKRVIQSIAHAVENQAFLRARALGEEALTHLQTQPSIPTTAWALYFYLGRAYRRLRQYEKARAVSQQAWELVQKEGTDQDKADVAGLQAVVEWFAGNWSLAEEKARESISLAHRAGSPLREAMSLEILANAAVTQGNYDTGIEHRKRALELYQKAHAWKQAAICLSNLGTDLFQALRHKEALRYLQRSQHLMEDLNLLELQRVPWRTMGHVLLRQGRFREAEKAFRRAVDLYQGIGEPLRTTWLGLAYAHLRQGALTQARHILEAEAERSQREGHWFVWGLTQWHLGTIAYWRGELGRARTLLMHAWERVQKTDLAPRMLALPLALGEVHRVLRDVYQAQQLHQWALAHALKLGTAYTFYQVEARVQLALTLLQGGYPRSADRLLTRAETLATTLEEPPLRAQVHLARARVALHQGNLPEARRRAQHVLARAQEMGDILLTTEAAFWHGYIAYRQGEQEAARQSLHHAYTLTREHGLLTWQWIVTYLQSLLYAPSDEQKKRTLLLEAVQIVEKLALSLPKHERTLVWGCPWVTRLLRDVGSLGLHPRAQRRWVHLPDIQDPHTSVPVLWTIHAGPPDTAMRRRYGKSAWQRHRILRLIREATSQRALVPPHVLAEALNISPRTVRRYVHHLEQEGLCRRVGGRIIATRV